jgi:hypothetical protein
MTLSDMTSGDGTGTGTAGDSYTKYSYPGTYSTSVNSLLYRQTHAPEPVPIGLPLLHSRVRPPNPQLQQRPGSLDLRALRPRRVRSVMLPISSPLR